MYHGSTSHLISRIECIVHETGDNRGLSHARVSEEYEFVPTSMKIGYQRQTSPEGSYEELLPLQVW